MIYSPGNLFPFFWKCPLRLEDLSRIIYQIVNSVVMSLGKNLNSNWQLGTRSYPLAVQWDVYVWLLCIGYFIHFLFPKVGDHQFAMACFDLIRWKWGAISGMLMNLLFSPKSFARKGIINSYSLPLNSFVDYVLRAVTAASCYQKGLLPCVLLTHRAKVKPSSRFFFSPALFKGF